MCPVGAETRSRNPQAAFADQAAASASLEVMADPAAVRDLFKNGLARLGIGRAAEGMGGAGGTWPVIGETPGGAIGQSTPLSCGAACGEMVSGVPQATIIQRAGTPMSAGALGDAIGWRGGATGAPLSQLAGLRGPWVAELRSGSGGLGHFVVVDGAQGGNLMIRDPWAGGSTYQMTFEAFTNHWTTRVVVP